MSRLIIYITGKPNLHGHKRREFLWSPAHGVYLFNGKELAAEEFNAAFDKAMKTNADLNPRVKVLDGGAPAPAVLAPVSTIVAAHEVTADEAVAVLQRLAPELLKKRPGRKPSEATLEVA